MAWAGLKKCIPAQRSLRFGDDKVDAISSILRVDVLVKIMHLDLV